MGAGKRLGLDGDRSGSRTKGRGSCSPLQRSRLTDGDGDGTKWHYSSREGFWQSCQSLWMSKYFLTKPEKMSTSF